MMMRIGHVFVLVAGIACFCRSAAADETSIPNPLIDYDKFLGNAVKVQTLRNQRRISEADFLRLAAEPGTIVFDARSDEKFALLHVRGARHLSLPDVTAEELAKIIPDTKTRVLIYCNNNFVNEPKALPPKAVAASLNLYTFNTLYSYGYTNVYELGPLIDIKKTILSFEGSLVATSQQASTSSAEPVRRP